MLKNKDSINLQCHVPVYISTNFMPNFREDMVNINRRLAEYNTKEIPMAQQVPGVLEGYQLRCMEYLHWMADYISTNRGLVDEEDLFYEKEPSQEVSCETLTSIRTIVSSLTHIRLNVIAKTSKFNS